MSGYTHSLEGQGANQPAIRAAVDKYHHGKEALEKSGFAVLAITTLAGFGAVFALNHYGFGVNTCLVMGTPLAAGILGAIPFCIDIPRRKAVNAEISKTQPGTKLTTGPCRGEYYLIQDRRA